MSWRLCQSAFYLNITTTYCFVLHYPSLTLDTFTPLVTGADKNVSEKVAFVIRTANAAKM